MEDKKTQILDKVRKLLAKANDSGVGPEESAAFREKADELMVAYAIETWQVSAETPLNRPQPEMRMFDMSWWSTRNPFYHDHWWLMNATATHCRCVCVSWDFVPGQMKVVGLPADLDYFDLLFTQLMLEMAKRLEPKPDPNGEVGHEVFKLRQAGMDWKRITHLIWDAKLIELTPAEVKKGAWVEDEDRPSWNVLMSWRNEEVRTSIKNRLANANRRYVRDHGLQHQRNYVNPKVYQRSFAQGFVGEIDARMRRMRREKHEQTGSNALALRDMRQVVIQWVDENYPRPEVKDDGKKSKAVTREVAFDIGAYYAGSSEASKVNISGKPSQGLRQTRELPR